MRRYLIDLNNPTAPSPEILAGPFGPDHAPFLIVRDYRPSGLMGYEDGAPRRVVDVPSRLAVLTVREDVCAGPTRVRVTHADGPVLQ